LEKQSLFKSQFFPEKSPFLILKLSTVLHCNGIIYLHQAAKPIKQQEITK